MKSHARVVVIGGGIIGCSTLYQLAKQGCTDAVLLEKAELTAGSTWHAAGQVPYFSESAFFSRIHHESFQLYQKIGDEADSPVNVHACGSLRLARSKDEMDEYKRFLATARMLGIEADLIGPQQVKSLWPLLELRQTVGALHVPGDGYTDPSQTTNAFAKAARALGAEVNRHTRVLSIARSGKDEWRITTDKGEITCETIVNCTGFWGAEISAMLGHYLPVTAMEHAYLVTEQSTELEGLSTELPVLRDLNVPMYARQERNGFLVACYEKHAVFPWPQGIPKEFGQELFAPDLERSAEYLEETAEMIPALKTLGVKTVVNGPTGRTPDLRALVGPAHGLRGYFVFCGLPGAFLQAGLSKYVAEWIINGEPSIDLSPVDVRRFGTYATKPYLIERLNAGHAYSSPVYYPHGETSRGRLARTSPLYERLKAKRAVYGVRNGWEVPNWFAPQGVEPVDTSSYGRANWFPHVAAEVNAVRKKAGILDLTSLSTFEVLGSGAKDYLDRLSAGRLPAKDGEAAVAPMLTSKGGVAALMSISRVNAERFIVTGWSESEQRDEDWLRANATASGVQILNVTGARGTFLLAGPESTRILEAAAGQSLTDVKVNEFRKPQIGFATVRALRVDGVAQPAWEVHHYIEHQIGLYQSLMAAGEMLGLTDIGMRAYESLRVEAGQPRWGADMGHDSGIDEAGVAHLVDKAKKGFIGRDAMASRANGKGRHMTLLSIKGAGTNPWGGEIVVKDGKDAGFVTSGAYAQADGTCMVLARVDGPAAKAGAKFEVEIFGERYPATVVDRAV